MMKEPTQDEINKFFKEKEDHRLEFDRLDKKVKEYKRRIKQGQFELEINWECDISEIDLNVLKTPLADDIKERFLTNYSIINLRLDEVLKRVCKKPDRIFPKENLWAERQPHNIARVLECIEGGIKIIPPLIQPSNDKFVVILDGNHRIAVSRYLKLEKIPFIVEKKYLQFTEDLE